MPTIVPQPRNARRVAPLTALWLVAALGPAGSASAQLAFTRVDLSGVTEHALHAVAYGDGVFVAVGGPAHDAFGGEAVALRSTDGRAWTATTFPDVAGLVDVAFADGQWLATGALRFGEDPTTLVQRSTDGRTWSPADDVPEFVADQLAFADGRWVAVGKNGTAMFSDDAGATWTDVDSGTMLHFNGITRGPEIFLAVGAIGNVRTSVDGTAWTLVDDPGSLPGMVDFGSSVAYGDGLFLSGDSNTHVVHARGEFFRLRFDATGGDIQSSTDLATWTVHETDVSDIPMTLVDAASGNGVTVIVGDAGFAGPPVLYVEGEPDVEPPDAGPGGSDAGPPVSGDAAIPDGDAGPAPPGTDAGAPPGGADAGPGRGGGGGCVVAAAPPGAEAAWILTVQVGLFVMRRRRLSRLRARAARPGDDGDASRHRASRAPTAPAGTTGGRRTPR